jgi:hypothetical protein
MMTSNNKSHFMAVGFDSRSFPSRADVAIEQFGSDNRELNTNMTAQPKIVQDAVALADQISRALSQSGYNADFSLESLKEVDRFFDEHGPPTIPFQNRPSD